ncbi:hypothetical protein BT63DRAFT_102199 [Microthyrium microscopicum]|uniref:Fucose-specific lectin n=1 Tax=Microthyrium microscopicum TaxID=703497 RepID=A0A6A6TWF1_9PEZI|nr:hypothetical protein BT63DRAFT_102199 [Microthyrium microscopicum]
MRSIGFLVVFARLVQRVSSQALTAWYTSIGPQIIWQNASSGDILYSTNIGSGTAGGFTQWAKLPLTFPPKNGTALASTGFTGGNGNLYGQLFYFSASGRIVEAATECVLSTGVCNLQGIYVISNAVTTGIDNSTGLSASIRSASDGYRVFYHDTLGRTRMLNYSGPKNITWGDGASVIDSTTKSPLALATDGGNNITTYAVVNNGSMFAATLRSDNTWQALGSPKDLPAWSPANVSLAAADSANSSLRYVYYIGTDRVLHEIASNDTGLTWTVAASPSTGSFPLADEPNARFAAASTDNTGTTTSFFYISGGSLIQAVKDSGNWRAASTVFTNLDGTAISNATTRPSASASGPANSSPSGRAAKIGAGIGIGLGIPILAAVAGFALLRSRRRNKDLTEQTMKKDAIDEAPPYAREKAAQEMDSPPVVYELHGPPPVHELGDDHEYELPGEPIQGDGV